MESLNLSRNEMKNLLRDLNLYKNLTKELWNRGKQLFQNLKNEKSNFLVEYFPKTDMNFVNEKAMFVFEKYFWVSPKKEEIEFKAKESLLWGMRVYMNDKLVDLSFEKIDKNLRRF